MDNKDKALLTELLRLADGQPKGPWMPISDWNRYAVMQENHPHERVVCTFNQTPVHMQGRKMDPIDYCGAAKSTAEFICAARNAMPTLKKLLEELDNHG